MTHIGNLDDNDDVVIKRLIMMTHVDNLSDNVDTYWLIE